MSDRLPPRRRSGGGRHVATRRPRRPWTGLAQLGVAAAMGVGIVLVVVNPSPGDAAAASAAAWRAGFAREVAPSQAEQDVRAAARADIADVATAAVAQAADVRARALQANLPAAQLATLDSLQQQVDELVTRVESRPRVSRSADRTLDGSSPAATSTRPPSPGLTPPAASNASSSPAASGAAPTADASVPTGGVSVPTPDASVPTPGASVPAGGASVPTVGASAPADGSATATATATDAAGASAADAAGPDPSAPQITVTDTASVEAALPAVTSAQDAAAAALRDAVLALAQQAAQVSTAADAATAQAAAAASAAHKAAWKVSLQGYANGRIPASALCAPSFDASALLRCDATEAIDQLDAAFAQAFGHHLTLNDSYRSYAAQVQCTRTRGWLCATPGTSNHGLGIAVDIGDATSYSSAAYAWLTANGPAFGWHNPAWALPSGYKHEPWHWEYVG